MTFDTPAFRGFNGSALDSSPAAPGSSVEEGGGNVRSRSRRAAYQLGGIRERVANALRLLGYGEIQSILAERRVIDVDFEFRNQHYAFDKVDATAMR